MVQPLIFFSIHLFDLFWGLDKKTAEGWATALSRPVIQCQAGSTTRWIGGPFHTKGARDAHTELTLNARLQATNCTPGTLLLCHQCVFVWVRDCVSPADTICSVLCELVHILSLYTSSVPVFSLSCLYSTISLFCSQAEFETHVCHCGSSVLYFFTNTFILLCLILSHIASLFYF